MCVELNDEITVHWAAIIMIRAKIIHDFFIKTNTMCENIKETHPR
jgi:uncharacterized protein with HEPN domain